MGCLLDDLRYFGIKADLSVDDSSPGREGMAQDDGTSGGTLRGRMDRCRESQSWTPACSSLPERDGKDQGNDSPKQACSCWFARHNSKLASSGAILYPPGVFWVCRCRVVSLWRSVCFVLFRFRLFAFTEAAVLRSIVLRYACAPTATRSYLTTNCLCPLLFCFFFVFLGGITFFRVFYTIIHCRCFLFVWRGRCTFSFRVVFLYLAV